MTWILPEGSRLSFEGLSTPLQVVRGIGSGSQGQVYEVELAGERLALKWYLPACIARDQGLERRLLAAISSTAPSASFLWPIALLKPIPEAQRQFRCQEPGFGYLMNLRPPGFVGAVEHYGGLVEISLHSVLRACLELTDDFHALHSRGLCYKDISLGNLFLEPGSGRILICDNDNVDVDGRDQGGVLGTPGFIAPEVLMGTARPSANSDLHSLAVLIFRLLTRHDPFRGAMELEIRCLDEPARRRLYGEDPVFIFDPNDQRNRPDPQWHSAALLTWPIYPAELQSLFVQTFGQGLHDPSSRVLTGQWQEALARTLDRRQICQACGQENFRSHQSPPPPCWSCGAALPPPLQLQLPCGAVVAAAGTTLHRHHFDALQPPQFDHPVAEVVAHPSDASILGLRNCGPSPWQVTLLQGQQLQVEPGRSCNLAAVAELISHDGPVRIDR
jgi:DNA-binding helix-hairpin-helix protein with protein kinase domain